MHYNLNERQKPKKNIPYKKIVVVGVLLVIAIAAYLLLFHVGQPATPEAPKPA